MATNPQTPAQPSGPEIWPGVYLRDAQVNVTALDKRLEDTLRYLGIAHQALFAKPLVITSGADGQHVLGSAHYKWLAVDIRTADLPVDAELLFGAVLSFAAPFFGFRCYDERVGPGGAHWHLEIPEGGGS